MKTGTAQPHAHQMSLPRDPAGQWPTTSGLGEASVHQKETSLTKSLVVFSPKSGPTMEGGGGTIPAGLGEGPHPSLDLCEVSSVGEPGRASSPS